MQMPISNAPDHTDLALRILRSSFGKCSQPAFRHKLQQYFHYLLIPCSPGLWAPREQKQIIVRAMVFSSILIVSSPMEFDLLQYFLFL